MSTLSWPDILLTVGSLVSAGAFAMFLKSFFYKFRRPNGKKGGIVSFHTVIAFATITCIAMITRDWMITGLTVLLAYLIGRGRLDEGQHYMYQVVLSALIGVAIPYGIFYGYDKKVSGSRFASMSSGTEVTRISYEDKPSHAEDNRDEADIAPDLQLIDDEI